ncbi:hypothetical protein EC973_005978 [Apophysomyces ossiformis]|uniref:Protein kinase domain-containing protein n=1 Tax=Apophysomyces ossiformis TaxID=679940 RepID=A0A8H7BIU6_9FUNG|nr:hypothetical protein EC973_005978 [Apophysomyces ossiformis]
MTLSQEDLYEVEGQVTPPSSPRKDEPTHSESCKASKRIRSPTTYDDENDEQQHRLSLLQRANSWAHSMDWRGLSVTGQKPDNDGDTGEDVPEHMGAEQIDAYHRTRCASEPPRHSHTEEDEEEQQQQQQQQQQEEEEEEEELSPPAAKKSKLDILLEDDIPPPSFLSMHPEDYIDEEDEHGIENDLDLPFPLEERPVSLVDGNPIRPSLLQELMSVLSRGPEDEEQDEALEREEEDMGGEKVDFLSSSRKMMDGGVDAHSRLNSCPRSRSSLPNFYDDEVDAFFSGCVDDPIESSTSRANRWQTNSRRNEFLTEWPHFLTSDYFATHGLDNRAIEHSQQQQDGKESRKATTYFDTTFSILKCLGSGEFAEVWKVRHVTNGQLYAIKQTKTPFVSCDDRWRQIIEVDHMRALKGSKHCIDVVDAWEQEGFLFVQMELCDNGSLSDYISLKRDKIDEKTMWNLLYETATGVKDIHHADIIHLDLKPSNILIDDVGRIKIGDFGVSVRWPANAKLIKGEGDRRYMAPDLLREQFDKPADIFSLGLIFLEMAAQVVLPDTGESWETLRLSNFSDYNMDSVSHELQELIKWMLTPYSNERPTIDQVLAHEKLIQIGERRKDFIRTGVLYDYVLELESNAVEESSSAENTFRTPENRMVTWDTC